MKRNLLATVTLLFLCFQIVLAQNPFATVLKINGTVNVKQTGSEAYDVPAAAAMNLAQGDAIRTEDDGYVMLVFNSDKSMLKVRNNSELELVEDFNIRTVKVTQGRILSKITPGATTSFRIETPTSVASVKGTEFWVISNPGSGDRFMGVEGTVEVVNLASGTETMLNAGQMVISTPDGQIINMPVEMDEIPKVDEEQEQTPPAPPSTEPQPEGTGMESQQPGMKPEPGKTQPIPTGSTGEVPEEVEKEDDGEGGSGSPVGMGVGLGSVTIDGKLYNQIALRPELKFGKLGIGLDVALYMDNDGNIRKEDWDEFSDYLNMLYFLRWGQQGDPFFVKIGAMDNVTIGYGILMSGYSNTTEYPQVRKLGVHTGMQLKKLGWEAFVANSKEISGPGLLAGRVTYKPLESLPVTFGGTVVADMYPYRGLPDSDGDDVPDALDLFPDKDDNISLTALRAFSISERQLLRDNGIFMPTDDQIDNGVTTLSDYSRIMNGAMSVDVGMPILNNKAVNMVLYGQAASFIPKKDTCWADLTNPQEFTPGFGFAAPGIKAKILNIVNVTAEFRYAGENFLFNYWDRVYDFERVQIRSGEIYTKQQIALMQDPSKGIFGAIDANILGMVVLGAYYQQMFADNYQVKSFMSTASIPTGKIPKLADATAYYQRNNDNNPFDFKNPSENTILGYRVGFELGGGAVLYYKYQQTYRDTDGSGTIEKNEAVSITTIETGFSF